MKKCFILIIVALLFKPCFSFGSLSEEQIEVAMRMVGHEVLLFSGDSSSVVKPIKQQEGQYRISFDTDFVLNPDSLKERIDSVMLQTGVANHYVVEFVACYSDEVVHSYEVGPEQDVIPCSGRIQPLGCYDLLITFIEDDLITQIAENNDEQESAENEWLFIISLIILAAAAFLVWRSSHTSRAGQEMIQIGEFQFDKRSLKLLKGDVDIDLTGKEAELLHLLSASPNATVDRDVILSQVWGDDGDYVGRTLDVFISKLRKKLESDDSVRIVNIRGVGYRLVM